MPFHSDNISRADREASVRAKARRLIEGLPGPPYHLDCDEVRQRANVKQIRYRNSLPMDGRLLVQDGGFTIEINSDKPIVRQRFTLAHELAHTFFLPTESRLRLGELERQTSGSGSNPTEEELCDIAASEMLMPAETFEKMVFSQGPSVSSLLRLAQKFQTSLHATARRFAGCGLWKCHVGFWDLANGEVFVFRCGYGASSASPRVPKGFTLDTNLNAAPALQKSGRWHGWADIGLKTSLGESIGEAYVDFQFFSSQTLAISMAIFEPKPELLVAIPVAREKRREQNRNNVQFPLWFG